MSDKTALTPREALEQKKARLMEEAAAIDRDMAELDRVAAILAKYDLIVSPRGAKPEQPNSQPQNGKGQTIETMASLVARYKADANSPYHQLRYRTRRN
jgi:putative NADH-flavin reductase